MIAMLIKRKFLFAATLLIVGTCALGCAANESVENIALGSETSIPLKFKLKGSCDAYLVSGVLPPEGSPFFQSDIPHEDGFETVSSSAGCFFIDITRHQNDQIAKDYLARWLERTSNYTGVVVEKLPDGGKLDGYAIHNKYNVRHVYGSVIGADGELEELYRDESFTIVQVAFERCGNLVSVRTLQPDNPKETTYGWRTSEHDVMNLAKIVDQRITNRTCTSEN